MIRIGLALALLSFPWSLAGNLTGPQCGPAECCAPADQTVEQGVCDPYVQITIPGKCIGSGTVIRVGDETLILTCAHVAICMVDETDGAAVLGQAILTQGKKSWKADLAVVRFDRDLALLRPKSADGFSGVAHYTGKEKLTRGEDVWYCGTPRGFHSSLERSIVNQVCPDGMVAVNGNGWYGNSGCGVYVKRGGRFVLVGVMVRLVWVDPRSPILCEPQEEINRLLNLYRSNES